MSNPAIIEQVNIVHEAIEHRLDRFPGHPLFLFALREINTIKGRLSSPDRIDKEFYDSLNIGLMCARELELSDPDFCTYVYDMLEEIRKDTEHLQSH